jgi:hypothetical protein
MIDLGQASEIEVKWAGAVYKLREPSAKEMNSYQKRIKADESQGLDVLIEFVSSLGFPREICETLPAGKLNRLVESLVEEITKKN